MRVLDGSKSSIISIHALLAESDASTMTITICIASFLSTLSLRRATGRFGSAGSYSAHFYPRSPCGERLPSVLHSFQPLQISIHALLAESDLARFGWFQIVHYFYPRSPCGERLETLIILPKQLDNFYPRSPCGERRHQEWSGSQQPDDFYPRSPCGERH